MANSGTVYSAYAKSSRLYVSWEITEQDPATNKSTISWKAGVVVGGENLWYNNAVKISSIYINGVLVSSGGTYSNFTSNGTYQKLSGTTTVAHNNDGKKTIKVSISGWFYSYGTKSGSDSFDLTQINRKAILNTAPDFTDDDNPTITYSNPGGFSDVQACISFTGSKDDIPYRSVDSNGTSYTFNLTDAERTTLRKATTGNSRSVVFYVRTNINGTSYYSTLTKTLTIANSAPTLSPIIEDRNENTIALTGDKIKMVKWFSKAYVATGATAKKEATIVSNKIVNGRGTVNAATGQIDWIDSHIFDFTATDSRGNTVTQRIDKINEGNFIDYTRISCKVAPTNPAIYTDTDDEGELTLGKFTLNFEGNYWNGNFGVVENELTVQMRYKAAAQDFYEDTGWLPLHPRSISDGKYIGSYEVKGLDYGTTYKFQVRALDKLETTPVVEFKFRVLPVFDWGPDNFNVNGALSVKNGLPTDPGASHVIGMGYEGTSYDEWQWYMHPNGDLTLDWLTNGAWTGTAARVNKNGNINLGAGVSVNGDVNLNAGLSIMGRHFSEYSDTRTIVTDYQEKAATYNGNTTVCTVTIPKDGLYLVLGGVEATLGDAASTISAYISGAGDVWLNNIGRGTMASGGGVTTWSIRKCKKDDTVNLLSWGYKNATYNYKANLCAIKIND